MERSIGSSYVNYLAIQLPSSSRFAQVFFALGDIVAVNDIHVDFFVWYTIGACILCIVAIADSCSSKKCGKEEKR